MDFQTKIEALKGIGEKTAKLFHRMNIYTLEDLLCHYPVDYESFQKAVEIGSLSEGELCAVRAQVTGSLNSKKVRNLTVTSVCVQDGTGRLLLTFFNMPYLKNVISPGGVYLFRGKVQQKGGRLYMEQPRIYKTEEYERLLHAMQPRYPLTAGVSGKAVTKAVRQAFELCRLPEDYMPVWICREYDLMEYGEALREIHFPGNLQRLEAARRRLVFDEFFLFLTALRGCREENEIIENRYPMMEVSQTVRFLEALPFALTGAQERVWEEIRRDMQGERVMNRLIQGDVGSGKTILAILALLMTISNGYQGAFMAPTEVLARQHFEYVKSLSDAYHLPFRPILLTGSVSAREKREAYRMIESGEVNLVIGTHALIQEKVVYRNLALVVTDEQHRFGVRQREALAGKGKDVHVLVMSATPIPRTLAIILYGDLHISVVDELPAERLPIKNCVVGTGYRAKAYQFIAGEVEKGRQAYIICPMVEEREQEGLENVVDYTDRLKSILPEKVQISCLHGRMRAAEKNKIMEAFAAGDIDVLVSTTVIEVGIDVANATVMMVENAERFGLAQLHQLRGRVGRGKSQSYCIFVSSSENKSTMERLEILNRSNDGFFIAGEDLKLRGPGDLFGIRQSGLMDFKIGDIYQDASVLKSASEAVDKLFMKDRELTSPEHERFSVYIRHSRGKQVDFRSI